jgi:hypothetical protein
MIVTALPTYSWCFSPGKDSILGSDSSSPFPELERVCVQSQQAMASKCFGTISTKKSQRSMIVTALPTYSTTKGSCERSMPPASCQHPILLVECAHLVLKAWKATAPETRTILNGHLSYGDPILCGTCIQFLLKTASLEAGVVVVIVDVVLMLKQKIVPFPHSA